MKFYKIMLALATVLVGLGAGVFITFAFLILPGIGRLNDGAFIESYQAADSNFHTDPPNIQKEDGTPPAFLYTLPAFLTAVVLIACLVFGFPNLSGMGRTVLSGAVALFIVGALGVTLAGNVPLNTKIQTHIVDDMSESELAVARKDFENPWNQLTAIRVVTSTSAFVLLVMMLAKPKSFAK